MDELKYYYFVDELHYKEFAYYYYAEVPFNKHGLTQDLVVQYATHMTQPEFTCRHTQSPTCTVVLQMQFARLLQSPPKERDHSSPTPYFSGLHVC